ncbi:hypothetical protein SanaruYs_27830 [Chryseotalea sanaruensis]|uniref:Uncharacterized protein n=2 Tax=Chryseotalea sanaruensis TaxID=2482724 RepID=A0A401UCC9_9BACT|nr:hypothetical protein SanaruYs_27830 [Chryseotalea sanaruensis]
MDEINTRLEKSTANTVVWDREYKIPNDKVFYGFVHNGNFQLALRNMRLLAFTPMMYGKIEGATSGSIVFLNFKLFVLTRALLIFWSVFLIIAGSVMSFVQSNQWPILGALGILLLFHLIAWANFKQQLKPMRTALFKLLA